MPSLDIVIVNWNAGRLLSDCVSSIAGRAPGGPDLQRVVVVDNASTDGSAEAVPRKAVPLDVRRNAANVGFGAACNQGASGSRADYLLFLNPDTRLLPGTLAEAVAFMERPGHERVGISGVRLVDESGATQRSCARAPTPARMIGQMLGLDRFAPRLVAPHFMVEWDHLDTRDVPQVIGAFLLIRRGLFEHLGGFDERFFVYFEDADLCRRAVLAGWRCVHNADVVALHVGGGTTGKAVAFRQFLLARSRIQYAAKHFGVVSGGLVAAASLLLEPVARIVFALGRGRRGDVRPTAEGAILLWRALPEIGRAVRLRS